MPNRGVPEDLFAAGRRRQPGAESPSSAPAAPRGDSDSGGARPARAPIPVPAGVRDGGDDDEDDGGGVDDDGRDDDGGRGDGDGDDGDD